MMIFLNAKDNNERLKMFGIYKDTSMNTIIQFDYDSFQRYIEKGDWIDYIKNEGLRFEDVPPDVTYYDNFNMKVDYKTQYLNLNDLYYKLYKLVFNYFSKNYLMEAFAPTGNIITGKENSENIISFETDLSNDIISDDKFIKNITERKFHYEK